MSFLFIFLYGCFKALSDLSSEGVIFPKGQSWKNKWKLDKRGFPISEDRELWYYPINRPDYKERFPFSSTFLVALTDFWHKTELARHLCVVLAAVTYTQTFGTVADVAFMSLCYTVGFSFVYETIKRNSH